MGQRELHLLPSFPSKPLTNHTCQTNYVVGEFINPTRDLPRVIHTAMPLVILSYLLANTAYIFVLPATVIASSNTIAVQFGAVVFGPVGALVLALIVSLSCFGALNATIFTSGRLVYAAGKEGFLPNVLGRIGPPGKSALGSILPDGHGVVRAQERTGFWGRCRDVIGDEDGTIFFTPINAMCFNALLTFAYILVGEFATLVTFYGVAGYTFYFLTVLGLIVLRFREPHLERPYKTWISTPIIFCCVSLFLLTRAVVAEPVQTCIVVGFIGAGVPVWWWRVRGRGGRKKGMGLRGEKSGAWRWKFWRRD
jgi:amino acid transporter